MSSFPHTIATLEEAIPIARVTNAMILSGMTLLIYDYFLTLSDEVELIWKSRKSPITIIFLFNRYISPLLLAIDVFDRLGLNPHPTIQFCRVWIWLEACLSFLSFMSMHALVAMRVFILHGSSKKVGIFLWLCGLAYATVTLTVLFIGMRSRNHTLEPLPFFNSCWEDIAPYLWTVWLPSLVFECVLFILTFSKAMAEARRHMVDHISTILYRDGVLYFAAISVCSLFAMFVWLVGSPMQVALARYWCFAVANVAGARLVLNLKTEGRSLQEARKLAQKKLASSFCAGAETTVDYNQYIDLEDYPSPISPEVRVVGTVYPPDQTPHFSAV